VLYDVDESIRELLKTRCGLSPEIEVVFEAPTRDWAARRSGPAIDVFLYDIRENLERRQNLIEKVREGDIVTGQIPPTRWFNCSYLITAWTQRPDDEHRLLSSIINGMLMVHAMPRDCLQGALAQSERQVFMTMGRPLGSERSISDIWSALGGELKPSLDLVVVVPFEPQTLIAVGPPVMEAPSLYFAGDDPAAPKGKGPGGARTPGHGRAKPNPDDPRNGPGASAEGDVTREAVYEEAVGGSEEDPGRRFRFSVLEPGELPRKRPRPPQPR
jgi:Pvc16 N-terminal domain